MPVQDTEIRITDKATSVARNIAASFSNMGFMLGNFGGIAGRVIPSFNMLSGSAQQVGSTMGLGGAGIASMARFLPVVGAAVAGVAIGFGKLNEIATKATETLMGSLDRFREFDKGVREVGSIIRATPDQLDYLGERVSALSVEFGTDLNTQTKAYYETLSAGFTDLKQAAGLMQAANMLAVAGVTDVNSSVDLLTTTLNSYGVGAEQAMRHSDALFKAVEIGKTTVGELTQHMGMVASSAGSLGIPIEELGASIATLTLAGHNTAMASTEMARLYGTLLDLTPAAAAQFKKYGIEVSEARIKQEGLLPLMRDINAATGGSQEKLRGLITEERAFRGALVLSGSGLRLFEKSMHDMGNTTGSTEKAMSIMSGSIDYQMKRWAAFKTSITVAIGQAAAPVLNVFLNVLNKVIDAFNTLPPEARKFLGLIIASALAVPTLTKGFMGFTWGLAKAGLGMVLMTSLATFMLPQIILLGTLLLGAASAVGILAYSFKKDFGGGASDMMASLKRVMAALKFAFEFIRKGEISGAMVDEWDKTEAGTKTMTFKLMALWDGLKAMFEGAKEVVIATLDGMAKGLGDSFGGIGKWIRGLMDGSTSAKEFAASIPMEDLKEFGRNIGTIANGVLWLGKAFITVGGWIGWAVGQVTDLYNWLKKVWENPFSRVLLGGAMSLTGVGLGPGLAIVATGVKEAIGGEGGFGAYPMTSLNQVVAPPPVHERSEKKQKTAVTINQNIKHTTKIDGKDIVAAYKDKKEEHDFEGMEGDVETNLWTG